MNDSTGPTPAEVTQWLAHVGTDQPAVAQQLFELLYGELRRLARSQLRREDPSHTLSATALTHEAWFRLSAQTRTHWKNRSHFLAVAATMMRRILINHAQARHAAKRDAELLPLTMTGLEQVAATPDLDVLAVHEALLAFEALDPRAAKVVELRFFGGLEVEEVAEALAISSATVKRDWTLAQAWLRRELSAR